MREPEIFKLEDRVLFEAAAAAGIVEAADAAEQAQDPEGSADREEDSQKTEALDKTVIENQTSGDVSEVTPEELTDVDAQLDALIEGVIPGNAQSSGESAVPGIVADQGKTISTDRELVVINDSIKDKESIFANLQANQDVVVLSDNNGLTELNEYLSEQGKSYSAIHFVTHGTDGEVIINGEAVNNQTFDASEWSELGTHLTADGDILFYACDLAESAEGQSLIDQIAEACDADVAASIDTTGCSGDWDLEYSSGIVETAAITVDGYEHDLSGIGSFDALIDALETAVSTGGTQTVTIGANITFKSAIDIDFEKEINLTIKSADGGFYTLTGKDGYDLFSFEDKGDDAGKEITTTVSIENLILQDGGDDDKETALYLSGVDTLKISNSQFLGFDNGAVDIDTANEVTINSSWFSNNSADYGGAVNIASINSETIKITITGSSFDNNTAASRGGAVDITNLGGSVTINNSTFYKNTAGGTGGTGGAVAVSALSTKGIVNIQNSTFVQNNAVAEGGGGLYLEYGTNTIQNTLLIDNSGSDIRWEGSDSNDLLSLDHTMMTTEVSKLTGLTESVACFIGSDYNDYDFDSVFGSNTYDTESHTIAPDAFHKAAYSGTLVGTEDQLGNSREAINEATGRLTEKYYYSIGAVTAKVGFIVTQGDYETDYTGNTITPVAKLTLAYADGSSVSKDVTAKLKSDPANIQAVGEYTITPEDASVDGVSAVFDYVSGILTVKPGPGPGPGPGGDDPVRGHSQGVYCDGLYPGHFAVVPAMQADLSMKSYGNTLYGDIYTMQYPELVNKTLLHYDDLYGAGRSVGGSMSWTVTVDPLIHRPFTLDEPVREISSGVTDGSILSNGSALCSGQELFSSDSHESIRLFESRGDTLSELHEPLTLEQDHVESSSLTSETYCIVPAILALPERFFSEEVREGETVPSVAELDMAMSRKVENLKGDLERLLDKLSLA